MEPDKKRKPVSFSQPQLIAMLGLKNETFQAWRKRQGLFPWTNETRAWSRYSVAEVAATSVVVEMTNMGVTAQKAVDIAMRMLPTLNMVSSEHTISQASDKRFAVITDVSGERPTVTMLKSDGQILDVFRKTNHFGPFIVIDVLRHMLAVVKHVEDWAHSDAPARLAIEESDDTD